MDTIVFDLKLDYDIAIKEAYLKILLSDPENETFLQNNNLKIFYPIFHVRSPVPWHQSVINGKNFMRHNLFIIDPILIKLRNLWFEK